MNERPQSARGRPWEGIVGAFSLAICALLGLIGWWLWDSCSDPSFETLRRSCAVAVHKNPHVEGVEEWLNTNKIPFTREPTPKIGNGKYGSMDDVILYNLRQLGVEQRDVERSTFCISFWSTPVRCKATAIGLFIFSADGTLIDYRLDRHGHPL